MNGVDGNNRFLIHQSDSQWKCVNLIKFLIDFHSILFVWHYIKVLKKNVERLIFNKMSILHYK